jgi:hypothetical protein
MKYLILLLSLLTFSCAEPKKNQPKYEKATEVPQAKLIAESRYGYLYKVVDGNNTIYIYERGGGAGSIAVVKENQ